VQSTTQDQIEQQQSELTNTLNRIAGVRILVIGDIMLDIYRVGEATRISPEAPVPILLNPTTEYRLGGAGAVAAMCAALGADVHLVGLLGEDRHGQIVRTLVGPARVQLSSVIVTGRPTTTKERICGVASGRHRQQLGRIDYESTAPLDGEVERELRRWTQDAIRANPEIILISDYGKGVCTDRVIADLRESIHKAIVDPQKAFVFEPRKSSQYIGASCVVPNRSESGGLSARQLRRHLATDAAIVKLDQDGCTLATYDVVNQAWREASIPSQARSVHDVTGAGDQFLATLGCARAAGADWHTAATLANTAAGLQVERHGCVPVTMDELTATGTEHQ
jgi:rfaE bifunctional protein kinase chain/domain